MNPTSTIFNYTAAATIDGAAHWLLIQPGNNSVGYNRINRNVFLGVSGQPMDISTAQTVTNKTLGNTNTITLKDTLFTLQDDTDTTKQARFQISGITTATTRTYTLPNASSTLVDLVTAQTLTNKTLTSPVISGGSIDNSTITVDAISGHTVSGNGTVYGLSIHGGIIQTAGAGGTTLLQNNAVQASQLATNAIKLGYVQVGSSQSTSNTSATQVPGYSITVNVPTGARGVLVHAYLSSAVVSTSGDYGIFNLWDGAVGSGTQIGQAVFKSSSSLDEKQMVVEAFVTPSSGTKTYNLSFYNATGARNVTVNASPSFILVEAI